MVLIDLHGESPWKLALGFVFLVFLFSMGLGHVINPDYFLRGKGKALNEHNRSGIQLVGIVVALFAAGVFYEVAKDILHR